MTGGSATKLTFAAYMAVKVNRVASAAPSPCTNLTFAPYYVLNVRLVASAGRGTTA